MKDPFLSSLMHKSQVTELEKKEKEYWRNVSPQEELPKAGEIEIPNLGDLDVIFSELVQKSTPDEQKQLVNAHLLATPALFHVLRLFVGIANKRAYLDLSYLFRNTSNPDESGSLCGCSETEFNAHQTSFFLNMIQGNNKQSKKEKAAEVITDYLCDKGLVVVLLVFANLEPAMRMSIIEQVVFPREFQQSDAKRRGHGAEAEFAKLVRELGGKILPKDKDTNPMGSGDIRLHKTTLAITEENSY